MSRSGYSDDIDDNWALMPDTNTEALKQLSEKLEALEQEMFACDRTPNRYARRCGSIGMELAAIAASQSSPTSLSVNVQSEREEALRMLDNVIPFRLSRIEKGECVDASVATIREALKTVRSALPPAAQVQEGWKSGNEYAPYHPSASHVDPQYRDGWNACYAAKPAVQVPQWISVTEKKPTIEQESWLYTQGGNLLRGWMTVDDDYWIPEFSIWIGGAGDVVTHHYPVAAPSPSTQGGE